MNGYCRDAAVLAAHLAQFHTTGSDLPSAHTAAALTDDEDRAHSPPTTVARSWATAVDFTDATTALAPHTPHLRIPRIE